MLCTAPLPGRTRSGRTPVEWDCVAFAALMLVNFFLEIFQEYA